MMQLEICLKMKERPHQNVAAMISFFARNRGADWSSELISNFLHGLGIGGGGGGDHLELEPRIFATLHFSKESSSLLQILHHQVLLQISSVSLSLS